MNLLIINQPIENRGDESAHRSLMRVLIERFPTAHITVVFVGEDTESVRQMQVPGTNVEYIVIPIRLGSSRIPDIAFNWNIRRLVAFIHPAYRQLSQLIRASDYVINAPGGICMGGFQSWRHIFYLMLAKDHGKPIAYYSRSFGPFRNDTRRELLFKNLSSELLKYFDFISIRDSKTMEFADQLGLNYVSAIDTAFLDVPNANITTDITDAIGSSDYIVFVPNSLVWHIDYHTVEASRIDSFYLGILNILCEKYPSSKVVMLPQLFNAGIYGDFIYFERLKNKSPCREQVVIFPDSYSSDIQQGIIANAKMVIGARYHSIVFAINNCVPFIALSYEHKISGLLDILKLECRSLDLSSLRNIDYNEIDLLDKIKQLVDQCCKLEEASNKAHAIARKCFNTFSERIDALFELNVH